MRNSRPRVVAFLSAASASLLVLGLSACAVAKGDTPQALSASGAAAVPAAAVDPTTVSETPSSSASAQPARADGIQNVVLILADDLDTAAFDQVARLHSLRDKGLSLNSMVVTESLCCPSRASILRSQYVHNHKVTSNLVESNGGWATFAKRGEEKDCLPVWLHNAGVHTAYIGKYLNGYGEDGDPTAIPPGWDSWFVPTTKSGMYRGYGYTINADGSLSSYGVGAPNFLPDVIIKQTDDYLTQAQSPFYLQVNTTSPHEPSPVAPSHHQDDQDVRIPRNASFNSTGSNAPQWRSSLAPISDRLLEKYDRFWNKRVRSAESVADLVDSVLTTLDATGKRDSTLVIVTSDNGYHAAQRRLPPGKRTPYREDTVVPTVIIGPGITPGSSRNEITSTIDLAPTITELLGGTTPTWADGRSLVPLLSTGSTPRWRTGVATESLGVTAFNDPDFDTFKPPNYRALRTQHWLYVEYRNGERELFNLKRDPEEINNVINQVPAAQVRQLARHLHQLEKCSGASCRAADTWKPAA